MSVGELNETTPEQMLRYVHPKRHEIQMGFCFDHVNLGLGGGDKAIVGDWTIPEFTKIIAKWQGLREEGGWHALYLENHDQVRLRANMHLADVTHHAATMYIPVRQRLPKVEDCERQNAGPHARNALGYPLSLPGSGNWHEEPARGLAAGGVERCQDTECR